MGSILCCVEDKKQYENPRQDYKLYDVEAVNVHKGGFLKQPVDKQSDEVKYQFIS